MWERENEHFVRDYPSNFDTLTTSKSQGFCSFPHRYCEARKATFKSDTFPSEGFAASPIDTARLSAKGWAASLIDTEKAATEFAETSVTTSRSPDNATWRQNTQHDMSEVLRLPRKMEDGHVQSAALCQEKCNASSANVAKALRLQRKTICNTSPNTSTCHEVPRLPRETTLRDTWNVQKWTIPGKTPYRHGHMAITRTVANGCRRLRTVADGWDNTERTQLHPQTPRVKRGTLATHSGKNPG